MAKDRRNADSPELEQGGKSGASREEKLAAALRDNLLKRKEQSRARATGSKDGEIPKA